MSQDYIIERITVPARVKVRTDQSVDATAILVRADKGTGKNVLILLSKDFRGTERPRMFVYSSWAEAKDQIKWRFGQSFDSLPGFKRSTVDRDGLKKLVEHSALKQIASRLRVEFFNSSNSFTALVEKAEAQQLKRDFGNHAVVDAFTSKRDDFYAADNEMGMF